MENGDCLRSESLPGGRRGGLPGLRYALIQVAAGVAQR